MRRESIKMRLGSLEFDDRVWADKKRPNARFAEHARPAVAAWRKKCRRSAENIMRPRNGEEVQMKRDNIKLPTEMPTANVLQTQSVLARSSSNGREDRKIADCFRAHSAWSLVECLAQEIRSIAKSSRSVERDINDEDIFRRYVAADVAGSVMDCECYGPVEL